MVDADEACIHGRKLLDWGFDREEIAAEAGLQYATVQRILSGARSKITRVSHDAIMALKPKPYQVRSNRKRICGIGVMRKLQGLQAQGWTAIYMASLVGYNHSRIGQLARKQKSVFVEQATIDWVNTLVDKLGAFDIAELDKPMDGMSRVTAARAARAGWVVLADWDSLDIDDPRVKPHGFDPVLAASASSVVIDPGKVALALDICPTHDWDAEGREHIDVFPFTKPMNRAEAHEIVRAGSCPDRRGRIRFSANVLRQRLVVSERTVQRMRRANVEADAVLASYPPLPAALHAVHLVLACEEWDWVLRLNVASAVLSAYPIDRSFRGHLTILRATQHDPNGLGWTDAELAAWLGVTDEEAATLRVRAVIAATQPQKTLDHWAATDTPAPTREALAA
jgi:hypothetical protein